MGILGFSADHLRYFCTWKPFLWSHVSGLGSSQEVLGVLQTEDKVPTEPLSLNKCTWLLIFLTDLDGVAFLKPRVLLWGTVLCGCLWPWTLLPASSIPEFLLGYSET